MNTHVPSRKQFTKRCRDRFGLCHCEEPSDEAIFRAGFAPSSVLGRPIVIHETAVAVRQTSAACGISGSPGYARDIP